MKVAKSVSALIFALFVCAVAALPAATPTSASDGFHVEGQWNLGGKGGWSCLAVDPSAHSLFIPRTDHISVVDIDTGKVVGEIAGMVNLRNVALDDSGKYGYATDVADGTAGLVRVFDRNDFKLVASIPTHPVPFAIVFDPATRLVFSFSSRGHSVDVIDTSSRLSRPSCLPAVRAPLPETERAASLWLCRRRG